MLLKGIGLIPGKTPRRLRGLDDITTAATDKLTIPHYKRRLQILRTPITQQLHQRIRTLPTNDLFQ